MKIVSTNGCFDILHAGHVAFLKAARALGDSLVVGLNSDESVRALKGPNRPIQNQEQRAMVLRELRCVDDVLIVNDTRMVNFLLRVQPNIWTKGGDYTIDTLDQEEVATANGLGIEIRILPITYDIHTTGILSGNSPLDKFHKIE